MKREITVDLGKSKWRTKKITLLKVEVGLAKFCEKVWIFTFNRCWLWCGGQCKTDQNHPKINYRLLKCTLGWIICYTYFSPMSNNEYIWWYGPKYWDSFESCNNILFQIGIPIKKGGKNLFFFFLALLKLGALIFSNLGSNRKSLWKNLKMKNKIHPNFLWPWSSILCYLKRLSYAFQYIMS